jgi:hypothetical protein
MMFVLSLCFAAAHAQSANRPKATPDRWAEVVPVVLAVAIAVSVGSGAVFLRDFVIALRGLDRVVGSAEPGHPPQFVSYVEARELMGPGEARMNDRMQYHWTLPFRSIILADGKIPGRIVHGDSDLRGLCALQKLVTFGQIALPLTVVEKLQEFACTYVPPPEPDTIRKKS